jgi:hypothetical protein
MPTTCRETASPCSSAAPTHSRTVIDFRGKGELTPAQVDALLNKETADRQVLTAFLDERIGCWPWWDSAWRVVTIREVQPRQIKLSAADSHSRPSHRANRSSMDSPHHRHTLITGRS